MIHSVDTAISLDYEAIQKFCQKHHIVKMWLFGSILRDDFNPESDIDVLVTFDPAHIPGWEIVSMQDELAEILGKPVDFAMPTSLQDSVRQPIMTSAQVIYERTG